MNKVIKNIEILVAIVLGILFIAQPLIWVIVVRWLP